MCSRLFGRNNWTHRLADRDHSSGQQHDNEDDDDDNDDDDHDQLDVFPPVGTGHFLRGLLEALSLGRNGKKKKEKD